MARKTYKVKKYRKNKRTTRKKNMKGGEFELGVKAFIAIKDSLPILLYDFKNKHHYNISKEIYEHFINKGNAGDKITKYLVDEEEINYENGEREYCRDKEIVAKVAIVKYDSYKLGSKYFINCQKFDDDVRISSIVTKVDNNIYNTKVFILIPKNPQNFDETKIKTNITEYIKKIDDEYSINFKKIHSSKHTQWLIILEWDLDEETYEWNRTGDVKVLYNDVLGNIVPGLMIKTEDYYHLYEFMNDIENYEKYESTNCENISINPLSENQKKFDIKETRKIKRIQEKEKRQKKEEEKQKREEPPGFDFSLFSPEQEDEDEKAKAAEEEKEGERKKAAAKEKAEKIIKDAREESTRIAAEEAAAEEAAEGEFGFGGGKRRHKRKTYKHKKKYNKHSKKYKR